MLAFVRSIPTWFVSDVTLVNSGQPIRRDGSSTDFFGGTVLLNSRTGVPPRRQRMLLTRDNRFTRNYTARQASRAIQVAPPGQV